MSPQTVATFDLVEAKHEGVRIASHDRSEPNTHQPLTHTSHSRTKLDQIPVGVPCTSIMMSQKKGAHLQLFFVSAWVLQHGLPEGCV